MSSSGQTAPGAHRRIAIFGATSTIAVETARVWAGRGCSLFLVARDATKLAAVASDLGVRGGVVHTAQCDLLDFDAHAGLVDSAVTALGGLDVVLVAHGTLSDQAACERDFALTRREIDANFTSAASILALAANYMESQRFGTLVAISSVAGDRGRQSNYVYGTAKAALSTYLQGLRNRMFKHGVKVVTVKPGFVSTAMTSGLEQNALFADPAVVAKGIVRAADRGKEVVYLPAFWRAIMAVITSIPEPLFKRLRL